MRVIPVYPQLLLVRLADSLVLGSHRVLEGLPQTGERTLTCVTVWLLFDCRSVQTIDGFHHFLLQSKHRDGSTMDGGVSLFPVPPPTHTHPATLHVLSFTGFTFKWFYVSFNWESQMLSSPLSG